MTIKIRKGIQYFSRSFKHLLLLAIAVLLLGTCEKEPTTGSLYISTEYNGAPESGVECVLYASLYAFQHYEYLQKDLTDDLGEVLFENLEAGWYIAEAHKVKSSLLTVYSVDSVEIEAGKRTNKILNLFPIE
jgi:hypothetical protein